METVKEQQLLVSRKEGGIDGKTHRSFNIVKLLYLKYHDCTCHDILVKTHRMKPDTNYELWVVKMAIEINCSKPATLVQSVDHGGGCAYVMEWD
jgi:hypothetical protein